MVYKYNVESSFLILVGAEFLEVKKATLVPFQGRFGSDLIWILKKVDGGSKLKYKTDKDWHGVHLFSASREFKYSIPETFEVQQKEVKKKVLKKKEVKQKSK